MSLRDRQLAATRDLVREAALAAFLDDGYVATTMTGLAARAGVARQTLYNLFDSKAALLIDLVSAQAEDARHRDPGRDRAEVLATAEPTDLLDLFAAAHLRVVERTAPIFRVVQQASAVDPAVAEHLSALEGRRAGELGAVVDVLDARGALRGDVPVAQLRRGFVALTSPAVAVALLDAGVTGTEFVEWVRSTAQGLLLPPSGA